MLGFIQHFLSVEMVTVLQLMGFNFRKAIGEPLTDLVSRLILSKAQADPSLSLEIQRLAIVRDNHFFQITQDPEAYARLTAMQGQEAASSPDS